MNAKEHKTFKRALLGDAAKKCVVDTAIADAAFQEDKPLHPVIAPLPVGE